MKTWDTAIKKALYMYDHRNNYAYFYGAKGEVLTENAMDILIRMYPNHFKRYTKEQLRQIKNWSLGRIGYDCSGFITVCTGAQGNSAMQINDCHNVSDNLVAGVAGSLLWKPSHVGLDFGYGFFLHMPREGESIILGKISEYAWEKTGMLNCINYEGSDNR